MISGRFRNAKNVIRYIYAVCSLDFVVTIISLDCVVINHVYTKLGFTLFFRTWEIEKL